MLLDLTIWFTDGGNKMRPHSLQRVRQAKLLCLWPKGEYGCCCSLTQSFSNRYLTPPATSTAVERLFSAAGLIMDAKRNRLSPTFVDKLLFLREAHLLGICNLSWKWTSCLVTGTCSSQRKDYIKLSWDQSFANLPCTVTSSNFNAPAINCTTLCPLFEIGVCFRNWVPMSMKLGSLFQTVCFCLKLYIWENTMNSGKYYERWSWHYDATIHIWSVWTMIVNDQWS